MRVITLSNEKGGVGKTTLAVHLAAGLACLGHRVVLIDADPQGSATICLGSRQRPALYDLLVRNAAWIDCQDYITPDVYRNPIIPSTGGELLLVPGNIESRSIQSTIPNGAILYDRLQEIAAVTDYVVIDTSPSPSDFHAAIYLATDCILHPTEVEPLSLDGLLKTMGHVATFSEDRERRGLPAIHTLGIIPNRFIKSTVAHRQWLTELMREFGSLVYLPLHRRTAMAEATAFNCPVWTYAPKSPSAREVWRFVERAVKELTHVQA